MKRNISPTLPGPAGKLICQTDPFAKTVLPGLLANCHCASRKALPGFPSTAHAPRGASGQRICTWCRDRDLAKQLRFPSVVCYYLSQDTKAWEMSVGYKNLSGCSQDNISLLKAIERDCVFYCPVKDSAMSELEIWQLHPSHILTQHRQLMLQEDYISSCALGLQGDYTLRVKGFWGLALQPCRRISLLPAKNIWKAQGILPSLLYGVSRKCCSQEIFYLQHCQG